VGGQETRDKTDRMGDFLPGYVTTFCNPAFDKIKGNLIVVGKEDGKVYSAFKTKDELFEKMRSRKKRMRMMCYYRNLDFTKAELEEAWRYSVTPIDKYVKDQIVTAWTTDLAMIMRIIR